jgi:hypothetical protein
MQAVDSGGAWSGRPERRGGGDRRRLTLKSLLFGGRYRHRRRSVRRSSGRSAQYVDWYEPRLLVLALGVLLLSTLDGVLTLILLDLGAIEVNSVMARLIEHDVDLFAAVKVGLTGAGVVVLVAHSSFRLFRRVSAGNILSLCLAGYLVLLGHEIAMLATLMPGGVAAGVG